MKPAVIAALVFLVLPSGAEESFDRFKQEAFPHHAAFFTLPRFINPGVIGAQQTKLFEQAAEDAKARRIFELLRDWDARRVDDGQPVLLYLNDRDGMGTLWRMNQSGSTADLLGAWQPTAPPKKDSSQATIRNKWFSNTGLGLLLEKNSGTFDLSYQLGTYLFKNSLDMFMGISWGMTENWENKTKSSNYTGNFGSRVHFPIIGRWIGGNIGAEYSVMTSQSGSGSSASTSLTNGGSALAGLRFHLLKGNSLDLGYTLPFDKSKPTTSLGITTYFNL